MFSFPKKFERVLGLRELPIQLTPFAPWLGVRSERELTIFPPAVTRLRMIGVMPPLSHVPSWRAQALISFPALNTEV
jgi:hypothetical protein